jgi:hypothetical protein
LRSTLPDELVDELLAGASSEGEIVAPSGLPSQLTKRLVERAMEVELTDHLCYECRDDGPVHSRTRNEAVAIPPPVEPTISGSAKRVGEAAVRHVPVQVPSLTTIRFPRPCTLPIEPPPLLPAFEVSVTAMRLPA